MSFNTLNLFYEIMSVEYHELHGNPEYTFSYCVKAGDYIYTSHHGAWTYGKKTGEAGIEKQTKLTLENLDKTLKAADSSLDDVIQMTVWLKQKEDFRSMRDIYRGFFIKERYPARMTAFTEFLNEDCLIMIEAIAYNPK